MDKNLTYDIFFYFCREIIKVVYTMLVVVIKNLEIYLSNSNLLTRKNAICFKFLVQKKETSK